MRILSVCAQILLFVCSACLLARADRLTVASNPALSVTNAEVDTIIQQMNQIMKTRTYPPWDVTCPDAEFVRKGDVIHNANLLLTGNFDDLAANLKKYAPSADVLIVTSIDCAGVDAAGCSPICGEPLVVGQYPGYDAELWLHERGHNVCLPHSADPPGEDTSVSQDVGMRFMFWRLGIGHVGKTSSECSHFETTKLASIVPVTSAAAIAPTTAHNGNVMAAQLPPPVASSTSHDVEERVDQSAKAVGLTPGAFKVVGPPWVEGMPLDEIRRLSPADLDSIRKMLTGRPNTYWPQAINALAITGNVQDVPLIKHALQLPVAAVAPGANPTTIHQYRTLLRIKLAAPKALGILANRTQSNSAVNTLVTTAQLHNAAVVGGSKTVATSVSKSALTGLSFANTPEANKFLTNALKAQATVAPSPNGNQPVQATPVKIAPLSTEEEKRLQTNAMTIQKKGIDAFIKQKEPY